MSFADVASRPSGTAPPGEDAFAAAARGVAQNIFQLTTNVTSFKRLVDALGTGKDTRELRGRLHRQRDALGQLAKDTTVAVKRLAELGGAGGKAAQTKLVRDFQAVLKEFQRAQRTCAEREAASTPVAEAGAAAARPLLPVGALGGLAGGATSPQSMLDAPGVGYQRSDSLEAQALLREHQRQELAQLDGEIDFNNSLIEEREAGIAEIQAQIGEVNEIFQDLAVLVNEQGGLIDDIESNVVRTSAKTKEARAELVQAETSQKGTRKMLLWVVLIALIVFGIILAVVLK